ncbi:hypothetical protein H6784_00545 [Candidatus Nomurabacteria bacterium]|nr:hypothetical protein [Candidatus Kaiserbacteria bacterium]MCB9813882.1 hypothetical protein [Candidatus Nomurabacteria bacterium]
MSQKSIILFVTLFVLIVAGMFIYANLKNSELKNKNEETVEVVEEQVVPYPDITRIDAKHYFIDGKHTLVGEVNFPTPCDLLESEAVVMESFPEQVRVDFNVINNSDSCVQVATAQRFKVEATASSEATFSATFMGRDVTLNLIPAAEGETPEEFELFIKG